MPWTPGHIEWEKVELYIKAGSTQKKIAQALGISEDTLMRRVKDKYNLDYATFAASLKSTGVLLIEAKQFEQAMKGNIKMLIHLGRLRCDQADTINNSSPNQNQIDYEHIIMDLNAQIEELKRAKPNTNDQRKAEPQL